MTASAAEVEAAQKAAREHQVFAGRCSCGWSIELAPLYLERSLDHIAQAVADAVVAAAQPRIAAETLREESDRLEEYLGEPDENWTLTLVTSWLANRADVIEAQS